MSGHGGAIHADERPIRPAARGVYGSRDEFFAGARLAEDQYRCVCWRDLPDVTEDRLQRRALADDILKMTKLLDFAP
jgi:hypothetical protein